MAKAALPKPAWAFRAFQIDLARVMERPRKIAQIIERGAALGYNALFLYGEGALQYESHPECSTTTCLTKSQWRELETLATRLGVDLIPIFPCWGHTQYIWQPECNADLRELRAGSGRLFGHGNQLCPSVERTYTVLRDMMAEWASVVRTPYLHIGGDESWNNAVCPECRRRHGAIGAGNVMVEHFNRLAGIVRDLGKRAMIWADMPFYYPGSIDLLDREIIMVDWHYDQVMNPFPPQPLASHTRFDSLGMYLEKGFQTIFAPASGPGYFPACENADSFSRYAARARGMGVSPMSGTGVSPVSEKKQKQQSNCEDRGGTPLAHMGKMPMPHTAGTAVPRLMGFFNTVWEMFDAPYDLSWPALAYGADAAKSGRGAEPHEFLAKWARKHFTGDTGGIGEISRAIVELRGTWGMGTVERMEYFVSFELMNKIALADRAMSLLKKMKPRTDIGRGYRAGAEHVFRRARHFPRWQKAINEVAAAIRAGDFAATKAPLKFLEGEVRKIPSLLKAENKWWAADRFPENENWAAQALERQSKALPEFIKGARAVAAGRKRAEELLPAFLQLWMTVDAPMWAETIIEVSPDGKAWTKIYEVPQCEPYTVGPRNTAFRHGGDIRQLRISVTGIGGFVMHYLKLIFPGRELVPAKILSVQGAVSGAENLLTDDRRPTVFGDYEYVKYFKSATPQPPCVVTMELA